MLQNAAFRSVLCIFDYKYWKQFLRVVVVDSWSLPCHMQIKKGFHQIFKWYEPQQFSKTKILFCVLSSMYSNVQSQAAPTQHYPLTPSYLVVLYSLAAHPPCRPAAPGAQWRASPPGRGCVWAGVTSLLLRPQNSSTPLCLQMQRCKHMQ